MVTMEWSHDENVIAGPDKDATVSDYISLLPNHLLCYILSYIPTKSAVETSVLSKRWKDVWEEVRVLDFTATPNLRPCCNLGIDQSSFLRFVDEALLRNRDINLDVLRLHFFSGIDESHAKDWLLKIAEITFREIDLTCHCPTIKLRATLFEREKLAVLKLTCFSLEALDDSLHCPRLEKLHLVSVRLGELSLENLISGCPVLKELVIHSCKGISKLCIHSSSLMILEIKDTLTKRGRHAIILETPNLKTLYLSDIVTKYVFSGFFLEKAVVTVNNLGVRNHPRKLNALLQAICTVKHLKLGRATMEELYAMFTREELEVPDFYNLRCLEMTTGMNPLLLHWLHFTPVLWDLIIHNFPPGSQVPAVEVPTCLLSTLRQISIHR